MTGKSFRYRVLGTIAALLLSSLATLQVGTFGWVDADAGRTLVAVYIAMAAAWLTFCLQRRVAYTNALRSLWEKMVDTVHAAIQYTRITRPTGEEYNVISQALSCRIAEVRGVFRNVGEKYTEPTLESKVLVRTIKHEQNLEQIAQIIDNYQPEFLARGVYPFESLKQILGIIEKLGYGRQVTKARSMAARNAISALWGILRGELLKELDRDYPEFPDTPYEAARNRIGSVVSPEVELKMKS